MNLASLRVGIVDYPVGPIVVGAATALAFATVLAGTLSRWGFPLPTPGSRIGSIDGLRGYLALSVLIHHFIIWMQVTRLGGGWSAPTVDAFNQMGAAAVALFFMITGLVFQARIRQGFRATSWRSVYISRVFRIIPLVTVSVAAITVLIVARTGRHLDVTYPAAAMRWILTLDEPPLLGYPDSGRINAYVLWSLHYEWLFYLIVLPACALAVDTAARRLPLWTIPCSLIVFAHVGHLLHLPIKVLGFLPLFAIGMLAFEIQRREGLAAFLRTPAAAVVSSVGLVTAALLFPTPIGGALPLLALFFTCVACGNSFGGIFATNGALVLGECSFGIYLVHGILLSLLFVECAPLFSQLPTPALPLLLPIAAVATLVVTSMTFLLIERPAIAAGKAMSRLLAARPIESPSAQTT